jgi:hypothetical protein
MGYMKYMYQTELDKRDMKKQITTFHGEVSYIGIMGSELE